MQPYGASKNNKRSAIGPPLLHILVAVQGSHIFAKIPACVLPNVKYLLAYRLHFELDIFNIWLQAQCVHCFSVALAYSIVAKVCSTTSD